MSNPADKITAELMALADVRALAWKRFEECDRYINTCEDTPEDRAELERRKQVALGTDANLEQAIRRAVDWGEPAGYFTLDEGTYEHVEQWAAHSMPLYARSQHD